MTEPSRLRFPARQGAVIVVPEQTHASATYTRDVRIQVQHVVMYCPVADATGPSPDQCNLTVVGRPQPLRILLPAEAIDALMVDATATLPPVDLQEVAS